MEAGPQSESERAGEGGASRIPLHATLVLAALFLLVYGVVAILRIAHPFELEWVEGSSVDQVRRLLAGESLYVAPTLDYVPLLYTPLFFYASAAAAWLLGDGYVPLRAVSLAASLVCFAVLYAWATRESGRRGPGLLAAGFFAATFALSGAWFDLGRVDSLFLALLLASLYGLRFWTRVSAGRAAGALAAAAFLTKQAALIVLAPCLLHALVARRGASLAFVASFAVLVAAACAVLHLESDGWFTYYAFGLPSRHPVELDALWGFWWQDVLQRVPVAAGLAVFAAVSVIRRPGPVGTSTFAYALLGCLVASWWSRLHEGGYANVLMPAYAALGLGFALGAAVLDARTRSRTERIALWSLCLLQFAVLAYDPRGALPDAGHRRAGEALLDRVRAIEGPVLVTRHGFVTARAGKAPTAHWMAAADVLRASPHAEQEAFLADIVAALRQRRYAAIILDDPWFPDLLPATYSRRGRVYPDWNPPAPVTGMHTTPREIWMPRRRRPEP